MVNDECQQLCQSFLKVLLLYPIPSYIFPQIIMLVDAYNLLHSFNDHLYVMLCYVIH
jgi:hypothetical protein